MFNIKIEKKMIRCFYNGILLIVLLNLHSTILQALDCSDLFKYIQTSTPSFLPPGLSYEDLSLISSSYDRFFEGRIEDNRNSQSYVELSKFDGHSEVLYPVVKVDVTISNDVGKKASVSKNEALIYTPNDMIIVFHGKLSSDSIRSVRYQGTKMDVSKLIHIENKTLCVVSSKQSLQVDDNYADIQNSSNNRNSLRDFLGLRVVPQNLGQMLEFLYPPLQSVINYITVRKIRDDLDLSGDTELQRLENLYYEVIESFGYSLHFFKNINKVRLTHGEQDKKKLEELRNFIRHMILRNMIAMYQGSKMFKTSFVKDGTSKDISEDKVVEKNNQKNSSDWEEFMRAFEALLRSPRIQNIVDHLVKNKVVFDPWDWSYEFENDASHPETEQLFDTLIQILLNRTKNTDLSEIFVSMIARISNVFNTYFYHQGNLIFTTSSQQLMNMENIYNEVKIVVKKMVYMFALKRKNLRIGLFEDKYQNKGNVDKIISGCSGVIVSANTMLTAAHCVEKLGPLGFIKIIVGSKLAESVGVYIDPKYYENNAVSNDVAIVRFPEGTFRNMPYAKISFSDGSKKVVIATTKATPNVRKVFLGIKGTQIKYDPEVYLNIRALKEDGVDDKGIDKKAWKDRLTEVIKNLNDEQISEQFRKHIGPYGEPVDLASKTYTSWESYKGVQHGDSGSPIYSIKGRVVAIVSGGTSDEGTGTDGPLLKDSKDFIEDVLAHDSRVEINGLKRK